MYMFVNPEGEERDREQRRASTSRRVTGGLEAATERGDKFKHVLVLLLGSLPSTYLEHFVFESHAGSLGTRPQPKFNALYVWGAFNVNVPVTSSSSMDLGAVCRHW